MNASRSFILPLFPASPLPCRFLHRGVPPLRSRTSSSFDRSQRLDRSVSLLLSRFSSNERTRCVSADWEGSSHNLRKLEQDRRREDVNLTFSFRWSAWCFFPFASRCSSFLPDRWNIGREIISRGRACQWTRVYTYLGRFVAASFMDDGWAACKGTSRSSA